MTAHSLPRSVIDAGDPYERDVRASAAGRRAPPFERASRASVPTLVAFQSQGMAGPAPIEWLGPDLRAALDAAREQGSARVLFAPIGFLADHVEVLYDLDIEARAMAAERGSRYARAPSLNADDDFVDVLADVCRPAARAGARRPRAMAEARRIVIVGGGITGLSAAHAALGRARELGRAVVVTVLEGSPRFGGNLVTERVDGFLLDGGPDSWVATKPQASALARELGLGGALVGTNAANRRYYIAWNGRLHAVPEGLVLGVPTQALAARLDAPLLVARQAADGDGAARPGARRGATTTSRSPTSRARRLGREAAERLVAPLLGGISAGDASDLSVRAAFPQLVAMEREYGSLVRGMRAARRARDAARGRRAGAERASCRSRGGVGALVDALVERLRRGGRDPAARHAASARWRGAARGWSRRDSTAASPIAADAVLLAIPASRRRAHRRALSTRRSRRRLGAPPERVDRDGLPRLPPRRRRSPSRRLGLPRSRARWAVPSSRAPGSRASGTGRAPEGHVLLRAFIGGPAADAGASRRRRRARSGRAARARGAHGGERRAGLLARLPVRASERADARGARQRLARSARRAWRQRARRAHRRRRLRRDRNPRLHPPGPGPGRRDGAARPSS